MDTAYQKARGSAGSKGVNFQIDLLSAFLLNALRQNIRDWRLSTENKLAGKFDDVVLELSDGSAILLQAKHKENRKMITFDQLLSTNPKNEDFSLPKYFLSYLDIKTKFPVKYLIVCTNAQTDPKILRLFNQDSVCRESVLYYKDGSSLFTFKEDILSDLVLNAKVYHKNNLVGKGFDETLITEESAKEFLKHTQFYLDFPSGNDLEKATGKLMSSLKSLGKLFHNISYRDLHQKVKCWFEQPKGEYLTERRAKAMFCEIKSDKYRESLEHHNVFFKSNDFDFTNSKKNIFHVVTDGKHLLHAIKVYRSLQRSETNVLYASSDNGMDVQGEVIKTFELPIFTHLVIVAPTFSRESIISDLYITLRDVLQSQKYKRIIFVAEQNNKLTERMKSIDNNYDVFYESLTLADLSEDTQEMLLRKNCVVFQGNDASLEEILPERITYDYKKSVKSKTLEKLVKGEKITVGRSLRGLEKEVSRYYIDRQFERLRWGENESAGKGKVISEEDIYDVNEKTILISDSAGMGKTTVLKNLAVTIKKNNPQLWVIRIKLNDCTKTLRESLKNGTSINVLELLNCKYATELSNELEILLFSLDLKVVLMLDGVDEISPDYKNQILDLLLESQRAKNFVKIFVTTRSYMGRELERQLNATLFTLVPLTEHNQIDFFTRYWTYTLKLDGGSNDKCERYATTLIRSVCYWIREWYSEVEFVASPLHARMLVEVFLENGGPEEWQGCKEYLSADDVAPKLPEKMNIAKLYEMFIEKKRDIFLDKANPSGNPSANQALTDQFEECLAHHKSLALKTILKESGCELFSCYRHDATDGHKKVLKMGLIQKLDDELCFVHRTFAEYFVAESLLRELQLQNKNADFQKFLIDEVFFNDKYDITRHFLDNFLHNRVAYLPSNIFENYMSVVDDTKNYNLIHRLALEGNTEIIRLILKCIHFKIIHGKETSVYYWRSASTKRNTLTILRYLAGLGGINIRDNKDRMPLHRAAYGRCFDTMKFLVEMGADVNSICNFQGTALHFAAANSQRDIVEFLLNHGADISIVSKEGYTVVHSATKSDNYEIVQLFVKLGVDINIGDKKGKTVLHLAAQRGSFDIVAFFVEHDVDINIANKKGCTALHYAVNSGSINVVRFLVQCGVDINVTNEDGYTALHFAAQTTSFDIIECLVKYGGDINAANKEGNTALHFAVEQLDCRFDKFLMERDMDIDIPNRKGSQINSFEIVEFLLEHGAEINIPNKEGCTALHLASQINSFDNVELLVNHGVDINIANKEGCTALHFAAEQGNCKIVKFLVEHGVDINIPNRDGYTVLHLATQINSLEIVEYFVKHGADVNIENKECNTALHLAAEKGHYEIVKFLANHNAGAGIDIPNKKGYTALHFAATIGNYEIVEFLVNHDADINTTTNTGYTALHFASKRGSWNIVKFLVNQGARINTTNKKGYTALHFANQISTDIIAANARYRNITEFVAEHYQTIDVADSIDYGAQRLTSQISGFDIVELLVNHGADINIANDEGYTALHFAAEAGNYNNVKLLVERGVDINMANKEGYTALHLAAKKGSFETVEFLVKNGADINVVTGNGCTAVHFTAEADWVDILKFLIRHDADVNIKNKENSTALHFAAKKNSFKIVELLTKRGVDVNIANNEGDTALHFSVKRNSFKIVELLVQCGVDVNISNKEGHTALHFAAEAGRCDVVELLMKHDADVYIADKEGCTVLHFAAAQRSSCEIVKFLAKCGMDINIMNKEGCTALHLAAKEGICDYVEFLVKHGVGIDINIANKEGYTALHFAAERGSFHIVKILLENEADINITNEKGHTALDLANKKGYRDIVDLFMTDQVLQ